MVDATQQEGPKTNSFLATSSFSHSDLAAANDLALSCVTHVDACITPHSDALLLNITDS